MGGREGSPRSIPEDVDFPAGVGLPPHGSCCPGAAKVVDPGAATYAVDLAAGDDAIPWEAVCLSPDWSGEVFGNGSGDSSDCVGQAGACQNHEVQSEPDDLKCPVEDVTAVDVGAVEKKKRPSWRKMLQKVQAAVQTPLPGPFNRTDLQWETTTNQGKGKRRETQKATIPWDRLDDFLEGEMSARQHPCVFWEESRQCMKKDDRKQVRAESAIQEIR